jgi:hypothetical protein
VAVLGAVSRPSRVDTRPDRRRSAAGTRPSDAGRERVGHTQCGGGGHGGVDGVTAAAQHVDANLGRVGVDARDGTALADLLGDAGRWVHRTRWDG